MTALDKKIAREAVAILRALRCTWGRGWLGMAWEGGQTLLELDQVTDAIEMGFGFRPRRKRA